MLYSPVLPHFSCSHLMCTIYWPPLTSKYCIFVLRFLNVVFSFGFDLPCPDCWPMLLLLDFVTFAALFDWSPSLPIFDHKSALFKSCLRPPPLPDFTARRHLRWSWLWSSLFSQWSQICTLWRLFTFASGIHKAKALNWNIGFDLYLSVFDNKSALYGDYAC